MWSDTVTGTSHLVKFVFDIVFEVITTSLMIAISALVSVPGNIPNCSSTGKRSRRE